MSDLVLETVTRRTPIEVTERLMSVLCDDVTGLIGVPRRKDHPTDDPSDSIGVVGYLAVTAGSGSRAEDSVGSYSFDPTLARVRAVGEGVDRAAWSRAAEHIVRRHVSYAELAATSATPVVDPARFAQPDDATRARWGLVPYRADAPQDWMRGARVTRREDGSCATTPMLLPASVFVRSAPGHAGYMVRLPTQIAVGNTVVEAAVGVVAEAIERDALARAWLYRRVGPHVDLDSCQDPDTRRWRDHHRGRGRIPMLVTLPDSFGVPTLVAALLDSVGPVYFTWAFATHFEPEVAARKAIEELEGNRFVPAGFRVPETPDDIRAHADSFYFYQRPDRLRELDFLTMPNATVRVDAIAAPAPPRSPSETLGRLVEALAGFDVILADLTPPELAPYPIHAITVAIPGLVSLPGHRRPWHLDTERLRNPAPRPEHANIIPVW